MSIQGKPTGTHGELMISLGEDDVPVETKQPEVMQGNQIPQHIMQNMMNRIAVGATCYACGLIFPASQMFGARNRATGEIRYLCQTHYQKDFMRKGGSKMIFHAHVRDEKTEQLDKDLVEKGVLNDDR